MAWYNWFSKEAAPAEEKLNPSQPDIVLGIEGNGPIGTRESFIKYTDYYEKLEVVNRGVNMLVDDAAEIPARIGDPTGVIPVAKGVRRSRVDKLLNIEPNPFQDINTFKRNLITDYILDGNIFVYFDGVHLYHLPANYMDIVPDEKTYVKSYRFRDNIDYSPSEIIHIKENSFRSLYRGTSRLSAAKSIMDLVWKMRQFQIKFFDNGAVPGLILKHPSSLSPKNKQKMIQSWANSYSPTGGGRRPLILDGGMDIDKISNVNFRELDFEASISAGEKEILKVLGVPPIMLDSGNNANIRPNHRMYYLETVTPIVRKMNYGFERFFGYKVAEEVSDIPALQPELRDAASYYSTLVNTGIITPNEAREALNYEAMPEADEIRVPANIAGSATNPTEGGRPTEEEDSE